MPEHGSDNLAQTFDTLKSDYAAARSSRFRRRRTGYSPSGSHADYHYRSEADYLKLIELARDMDRNDLVVGPLIDTAVRNSLQGEINPDPKTGDDGLDDEIEARWREWSLTPDLCDVQGENTWHDLATLAFRHLLVDGDDVALLLREGSIQLVEGHLIRTPSGNQNEQLIHGVEVNDSRKRLKYYILQDDVAPSGRLSKKNKFQTYDVRDEEGHRQICHIYHAKRISQTRGVTAFAPVFDTLGQFEDLNFAKLVQAQIVSCFAIFRQRGEGFQGATAGQYGAKTTETRPGGSIRTLEGIGPGMEIDGAPGEKLEGFSPNTPNAEFFPHVKLILQLVGINLGLPLVLVLLDASETNFSGWRGAVDQARIGFRRNQRELIARFCRPVYRWKIRQWMSEDDAIRRVFEKKSTAKLSIFKHEWKLPGWPYIEPLKDASAALLRVRNGLTSPRRLHAESGDDFFEVANEIVQDNTYAIRQAKLAAQKLNQEINDGQPVHWRELLSLPTPDGIQVALQAQDDKPEGKPRESK